MILNYRNTIIICRYILPRTNPFEIVIFDNGVDPQYSFSKSVKFRKRITNKES